MGVVRHLEGVATYPELRAAHNAVEAAVSEFYSSIPLDGPVEGAPALRRDRGSQRSPASGGASSTKTIDNFRRHGADLDAAGKARLAEIDVELSKLTTRFSENVLDSTNAFELVIAR